MIAVNLWENARLAEEQFRQTPAMFANTITHGVATVPCTATSAESKQPLQRNNVMPDRPVIFTVTNAQYAALGSPSFRAELVSDGSTFLIYSIMDDPADATVDMRCVLKV